MDYLSIRERQFKNGIKTTYIQIYKFILSILSYKNKIYLNKEFLSLLAMGMALVINHHGSHTILQRYLWNNDSFLE